MSMVSRIEGDATGGRISQKEGESRASIRFVIWLGSIAIVIIPAGIPLMVDVLDEGVGGLLDPAKKVGIIKDFLLVTISVIALIFMENTHSFMFGRHPSVMRSTYNYLFLAVETIIGIISIVALAVFSLKFNSYSAGKVEVFAHVSKENWFSFAVWLCVATLSVATLHRGSVLVHESRIDKVAA